MAHRQVALLKSTPDPTLRPNSAPPPLPHNATPATEPYRSPTPSSSPERSSTIKSRLPHRNQTEPQSTTAANGSNSTSLDLMNFLQRSEAAVVKTRSGSVLSRGFILKTDHYPSGVS